MTTEIIINVYHIIITLGIVIFASLFLFLLHNFGGIKLFVDKDKYIANKFFDKFPLVTTDFLNKPLKEQTIENNQEIHELNKKLDKIQYQINQLNIHQSMTLDEVKRNDRAV